MQYLPLPPGTMCYRQQMQSLVRVSQADLWKFLAQAIHLDWSSILLGTKSKSDLGNIQIYLISRYRFTLEVNIYCLCRLCTSFYIVTLPFVRHHSLANKQHAGRNSDYNLFYMQIYCITDLNLDLSVSIIDLVGLYLYYVKTNSQMCSIEEQVGLLAS